MHYLLTLLSASPLITFFTMNIVINEGFSIRSLFFILLCIVLLVLALDLPRYLSNFEVFKNQHITSIKLSNISIFNTLLLLLMLVLSDHYINTPNFIPVLTLSLTLTIISPNFKLAIFHILGYNVYTIKINNSHQYNTLITKKTLQSAHQITSLHKINHSTFIEST